jgi:hypothetical protein
LKMISAYGEPLRIFHAYALLEALENPPGRWHMHPLQLLSAAYYVTVTIIVNKSQPVNQTISEWMKNRVDLLCDREIVQDHEMAKDKIYFKSPTGEVLGWINQLAVPLLPIVDEAQKW